MLNKKNLGLGIMVVGGVVTIAGVILAKKAMKEKQELEPEFDLELEEVDATMSHCGMDTNCDDCSYCEYYTNPDNFKKGWKGAFNTPTEWEPHPEAEVEVGRETEAESEAESEIIAAVPVYNPTAAPESMSQADIESVGNATF